MVVPPFGIFLFPLNTNDFRNYLFTGCGSCNAKMMSLYFAGVAGLDNLDLMTKTLDRANRFKLPMSVGGMSTNRLRMLMAAAGRRK